MSHSKAEASPKRRVFSEQFKQDAVRLVVSENYSFAGAAGREVMEADCRTIE